MSHDTRVGAAAATYGIGTARIHSQLSQPTYAIVASNSRHGHGKHVDCDIGVERLQDVLRDQGFVHSRVLVLLELWQLVHPNVDHDACHTARRACFVARVIYSSTMLSVTLCGSFPKFIAQHCTNAVHARYVIGTIDAL